MNLSSAPPFFSFNPHPPYPSHYVFLIHRQTVQISPIFTSYFRVFCNESSVCWVWKLGLFWLCYVASVCWVDIGSSRNDNKIRISIRSLRIQCCGQIQFFLCEVLLNIIIMNRRLAFDNKSTFTDTITTAVTWWCWLSKVVIDRLTKPVPAIAIL